MEPKQEYRRARPVTKMINGHEVQTYVYDQPSALETWRRPGGEKPKKKLSRVQQAERERMGRRTDPKDIRITAPFASDDPRRRMRQ